MAGRGELLGQFGHLENQRDAEHDGQTVERDDNKKKKPSSLLLM